MDIIVIRVMIIGLMILGSYQLCELVARAWCNMRYRYSFWTLPCCCGAVYYLRITREPGRGRVKMTKLDLAIVRKRTALEDI